MGCGHRSLWLITGYFYKYDAHQNCGRPKIKTFEPFWERPLAGSVFVPFTFAVGDYSCMSKSLAYTAK